MLSQRDQKIKLTKRNSLVFTCGLVLVSVLFLLTGIGAEVNISKYYRTFTGTCTLSNLNNSQTIFDDGAHYFTLYYSTQDSQYFNTSEIKPCHVVFPQIWAKEGLPVQQTTPLRGFYFGIGATMFILIFKELYIQNDLSRI